MSLKKSSAWRKGLPSLLHRLYKTLVSPLFMTVFGPSCRFWPSCSDYAKIAITDHGWVRGSWLALRRLARCHPWGGQGFDPPPVLPSEKKKRGKAA